MKTVSRILFSALLLCGLALTANAQSDKPLMMHLHKAMMAPGRPAADKAVDSKRKPEQVLAFFGVKPGMKVIDIDAASGYYSELLAAAVGPTGTVYAQNSARMMKMRKNAMMTLKHRMSRMPNIKMTEAPATNLGMDGKLDFALVSLHLHDVYNFAGKGAAVGMLKGIYAALKPGGKLGLIDHIGEPGKDNKKLHRIPMSTAEGLLKDAGFKIEGQSNVLRNPNDNHTMVSHAPKMHYMTDRMVILAMKPE